MPVEVLAGGWRPVRDFSSWDAADSLRTATVNDTPSLDVRVDFRGGRYWVDVRRGK